MSKLDLANKVLIVSSVSPKTWLRKLQLDRDAYIVAELEAADAGIAQVVGAQMFGACIAIGRQAVIQLLEDGISSQDMLVLPEKPPRDKHQLADIEYAVYAYLESRDIK